MEPRSTVVLSRDGRRQARSQTNSERGFGALYRLTDQLFRARSVDELYAAAVDSICDALACTRASVLRFDAGGTIRFAAWRNLSDRYRDAVDGHSPWKAGDSGARPIFIEDIRQSGEPEVLKRIILAEGIQALAFVPLEIHERIVGKFMLYYDDVHVFTEQERELAFAIGRQLGFALDRNMAESASRRLAALVESSNDAIVAKDLDGTITDWNKGAERLFGYRSEEVVGKSIKVLIPTERHDEETDILARIRAGDRVDGYETIRVRKDGSLIDVSLTISPIRDRSGRIVGASKIARDISDRRRAQERQELLLREMNHRVKNLFALVSGIISLNAKSAETPAALATTVSEQLSALSRAHALTMAPASLGNSKAHEGTTLHALVAAILTPYDNETANRQTRFSIAGDDIPLAVSAVTPVALLFHEFATNAAKYGSLSVEEGVVHVTCRQTADGVVVLWRESGGPPVRSSGIEGFGSQLVNTTARQLGHLSRTWDSAGVVIELTLLHSHVAPITKPGT